MVRENHVCLNDLIYPIFVVPGTNVKEEIPSMPGCYHLSVDNAVRLAEDIYALGLRAIEVFGLPAYKDEIGSSAWDPQSPVQCAIRAIKKALPDMVIVGDVCLCQYTDHGHCGQIKDHYVDNDATLKLLNKVAVSQAEAGADIVAPSDMMDGRIASIRQALDEEGFINTIIMSYAAKYASGFYGPFRDPEGSAPSFGDRKSYQMDPHNSREGIKEALLDVEEGADIIMVKPAMNYLDMITKVKDVTNVPIAAYSTSAEYAMVKAAAKMNWVDEERIMCEMAVSAYRAGAQIYLTYYAKELAKCIEEGKIG